MVYSDATAMSLCTFGLTILQHHYDYHVERTVMKRRVAMCHMIYKKGHVRAQGTYNELCSSGLDTAFLLRTDEERERRFLSLGPTVTEQEVITGTAETPKVNPAQQRRGPSHGKARHVSLPLPGLRVGRCRPRGAKQKRRCERDEEKDDTERLTGSRGGRQGEEEREESECGRQGEEVTMWRSRGGRRRAWPTVCWGRTICLCMPRGCGWKCMCLRKCRVYRSMCLCFGMSM
ncbi:uncharacterized protein LOC121178000 isoform X3 [Toxotes jaculatrix]|uniref:uncharacterized protein LOC121178000 isoform X3 n=1 Tax=Toxotes jaculatrix TaxID=941984 RepID=UPI001B3ABC18|nr:uncharacterized protein LOC121178000 isoform X3 [Toxotes jaculatrix]